MESAKREGLTIWLFVGAILVIYGLIIMAAGVYYLFSPPKSTALYHLDPSLWWGAILLVVGMVFILVDWKHRRLS